MKIVTVIPLKKGPLKEDLSYFTTKEIESGSIVSVNLRNKKVFGLVVSCEDVSDSKINIKGMNFNLKKVLEVKDESIFLKKYLESILLVSKYFVSKKNNAFTSLIPAILREEYDKIAKFQNKKLKSKTLKNGKVKSEKLLLQESFENRISIYRTLIRENFALKKSIFIVLPTENELYKFEEHLSKGIEQFAFLIHGGLSTKKTLESIKNIMSTEHPILILATPPFLSIPRPDIGLIILERESSGSYKMPRSPHIDMRTFVEIFATKTNTKLILGDNLLRFETIARREVDGLIPMYPLSFRLNFKGEIETQNPKQELKDLEVGKNKKYLFKIFPSKTLQEIESALVKKENIFVFALRKGLATQTVCRDCGETVMCNKCSAPLVLYNAHVGTEKFFACNRCGEEKNAETVCKNCSSWNLIPLGIGTDTVFEELSKTFPKTKIFKLDKESTKSKKEAENIIKEFSTKAVKEGKILIGTEMALYYLKNKVDMSVIASFDSFWSIPNFKMSEKIIQLVVSIIQKTENKLIIQTKNNLDPVILAIQSKNLLSFVRSELEDRKNMNYPPFVRFIKIKHSGNKIETLKIKKILKENFIEYKPLIFSGFVGQIKNKYITNALIKLEPKKWSLPQISPNSEIDENLLKKLQALSFPFEIFVDPEDLL